MFAEHTPEINKTLGVVVASTLISLLLGGSGYIWSTTVKRLQDEIEYNRRYIEQLSERIRLQEIATQRQDGQLDLLAKRLDSQRDHLSKIDDWVGPYVPKRK